MKVYVLITETGFDNGELLGVYSTPERARVAAYGPPTAADIVSMFEVEIDAAPLPRAMLYAEPGGEQARGGEIVRDQRPLPRVPRPAGGAIVWPDDAAP